MSIRRNNKMSEIAALEGKLDYVKITYKLWLDNDIDDEIYVDIINKLLDIKR